MKLQLFLVVSAFKATHALDEACPDSHCTIEPNTEPTVDSAIICPDLAYTTLDTFEYDGDVLIELRGPADVNDAADLVISAPHGGDLRPDDYIDWRTWGKTLKDSYTKEVSELLQEKFIDNYCKVPYLVINHLHRSRMDANREIVEAAQGNAIAEDAWTAFHTFINTAQNHLSNQFGTSTVNSRTGVHALLFDMHGYAGRDWESVNGSPLIQWGYRMSSSSLETCPLDDRSSGTIGTLTHARWMGGHSYECLVRGPGSLASRVGDLLDEDGGLISNALCGHGIPSQEFPSVEALRTSTDIDVCEDYANSNDKCHYYSGGYDVEVHERMNWQDLSGDHFNAVQAELPRCIRFGGNAVREKFADKLSVAVMSFLRDLYGTYGDTP